MNIKKINKTGLAVYRLLLVGLLLLCLYVLFGLRNQVKSLEQKVQTDSLHLINTLDSLQKVVFLQDINVPNEIYFADSLYILDPVTKDRLYYCIVNLLSNESIMVKASRRYDNYQFVRDQLIAQGKHPDLFYIPIQESLLNKLARSRAGARGLWQFMKSTGRKFGLKIDWFIDERLDPVKSTHAAISFIDYLSKAYNNDWALVAAAYNNGERRLNRAIREGKTDNYFGLNLNWETSHYFLYVLAWKYIVETKAIFFKLYGNGQQDIIKSETIEIYSRRNIKVNEIIKFYQDNPRMFDQLNPTLYRRIIPAKRKLQITVPQESFDDFIRYMLKHKISYEMVTNVTKNLSF